MRRPVLWMLTLLICLGLVGVATSARASAPEAFAPYKIRFLGAETAGATLPDELPSLSDSGVVIGNYVTNNNRTRPWVQPPGPTRVYLPLPPGANNGEVVDINANGVMIGSLWNNPSNKRLARWVPNGEGGYIAQSLCNNEVIEGVALNDNGVAIGHRTMTRVEDGREIQMIDGVRFKPGVGCQPLSQYGFSALPADINNDGDIVGGQSLLRADTNFNIGMPPGYSEGAFRAINNLGHISGTAANSEGRIQFVNFDMIMFETFGIPSPGAEDIDLNDLGTGIGIGSLGAEDAPMVDCCYCLTCTVAMEADAVYLDTLLLPAVQGMDLSGISDINNADQIVARVGPLFPGAWEVALLTPVEECASGCMRSQFMVVVPYSSGGSPYAVGLVYVRNENNQTVPNALVYASWQRPDGSLLHRTAITNAQGRALFFTPAADSGTYRLYVTDMERPSSQYDPIASNTLVKQLVVP